MFDKLLKLLTNPLISCIIKEKFYLGEIMEKTISSDFIRGHIDTIILKSLFDGCKHTAEIGAYIEEKSGNQYEAKQATLYSALKRLEKQKYVRPFWNDAPEGGRRRYFEVTASGRKFAEKNLSEWDFSRDVIDILVDETPKLKVTSLSSEQIEKIIEEDKKDVLSVPSENKTEEKPIIAPENAKKEVKTEADPALLKILEPAEKYDEINYKQILNDLFDNGNRKSDVKTEDLQENIQEESDFTEKIFVKSRKVGKTDFTDLIEKAEAEGYKIRVSTGKTEKISGKTLINKLNMVASLLVFALFLIEVLIISLSYRSHNLMPGYLYYIFIVIAAVFPAAFVAMYLKNPSATKNSFNKNAVYTALIIILNLLLIVFAIALLTDTDFSSAHEVGLKIVIPILILFDVFAYFLSRNLLFSYKNKDFVTK